MIPEEILHLNEIGENVNWSIIIPIQTETYILEHK